MQSRFTHINSLFVIPPSFENTSIAALSPKHFLVRALTATLYGTSLSIRSDVQCVKPNDPESIYTGYAKFITHEVHTV